MLLLAARGRGRMGGSRAGLLLLLTRAGFKGVLVNDVALEAAFCCCCCCCCSEEL
jgi:hypothetical protein